MREGAIDSSEEGGIEKLRKRSGFMSGRGRAKSFCRSRFYKPTARYRTIKILRHVDIILECRLDDHNSDCEAALNPLVCCPSKRMESFPSLTKQKFSTAASKFQDAFSSCRKRRWRSVEFKSMVCHTTHLFHGHLLSNICSKESLC